MNPHHIWTCASKNLTKKKVTWVQTCDNPRKQNVFQLFFNSTKDNSGLSNIHTQTEPSDVLGFCHTATRGARKEDRLKASLWGCANTLNSESEEEASLKRNTRSSTNVSNPSYIWCLPLCSQQCSLNITAAHPGLKHVLKLLKWWCAVKLKCCLKKKCTFIGDAVFTKVHQE